MSNNSPNDRAPVTQLVTTYFRAPPEPFDFKKPKSCRQWLRRLMKSRIARGLSQKPEEERINSLISHMGEVADDIFTSFDISEDSNNWNAACDQLHKHFVAKQSVIYERARFSARVQAENEPIENFITPLYSLCEHCNYSSSREEMIKDGLVVGIRDDKLSQRMQMDSELTLHKAIELTHQSDTIKIQQHVIRSQQSEVTHFIKRRNSKNLLLKRLRSRQTA